MTANAKLKNVKTYDQNFFGLSKDKFHVRSMYKADNKSNTFLILNTMTGIIEVTFQKEMNIFLNKGKTLFEQYGCYKVVGQDNGDSLALACFVSAKSYFILKLIKT